MKTIRTAGLIVLLSQALFAADESPDIISQQKRVSIEGVYQSWNTGDFDKISEFSIPISIYYPVNRRFSAAMFLSQASSSGESSGSSPQKLSGISDAQFSLNYQLENQNMLFSLSGGLPIGKKEMTAKEFATSVMLSQNAYNFQVPVFGQGLNLSPGFTWAKPLNEKTVLGLGASYQLKGAYLPVEGMTEDYNPGDEFLLTGGLDYQVSEIAALSFDLTVNFYGTDKVGDSEVYKSGTKIMAAAQYKRYFERDLLWWFGRFRSRAKSDIYTLSSLSESVKTQRDEFESIGTYRKRMNPKTSLTYTLEARYFFKMEGFASAYQAGAGILPETQVSPNTRLQGRVKLLVGKENNLGENGETVLGIEIGAGITYSFQ